MPKPTPTTATSNPPFANPTSTDACPSVGTGTIETLGADQDGRGVRPTTIGSTSTSGEDPVTSASVGGTQ